MLLRALAELQGILNFESTTLGPQFESETGNGRMGVGGFAIGLALGVHLCLLGNCVLGLGGAALLQWSLYFSALCFFHFSEFLVTAVCKPSTLTWDSYLLNHSPAYTVAALASWLEFWLELWLAPSLKRRWPLIALGLATVAMGQFFRAAAMWTARANFAHQIMTMRDPQHRLVTHGVYRWLRHPSYFGWFWWSIGTQVLLANPLCTVAYAFAAWDFFRRRIPYEEATLLQFYPEEYPRYTRSTCIGIPCIPCTPCSNHVGPSDEGKQQQ